MQNMELGLSCKLILLSAFLSAGCATKTPVTIVCEMPDEKLIKTLEFCPEAEKLGQLEDCLVDFVHKTLPEDNARKTELLHQIEKQRR